LKDERCGVKPIPYDAHDRKKLAHEPNRIPYVTNVGDSGTSDAIAAVWSRVCGGKRALARSDERPNRDDAGAARPRIDHTSGDRMRSLTPSPGPPPPPPGAVWNPKKKRPGIAGGG
jgi:hypothetical protein